MDYTLGDIQFNTSLNDTFVSTIHTKLRSLPTGIDTDVLFLFLIIFFVCYILAASVLFYHWRKYGMKNKKILYMESIFIIMSCILFWMALILSLQ